MNQVSSGESGTGGQLPSTPIVRDTFDRAERGGPEIGLNRPTMSVGAAILLALGTSAVALLLRRRAQEQRATRMAWLAMRASTAGTLLQGLQGPRIAAPLGGVGGAALLGLLMLVRAQQQQQQTRSGLDEVAHRLATVQLPTAKEPNRDMLRGLALGLGLAGVIARLRPSRPTA